MPLMPSLRSGRKLPANVSRITAPTRSSPLPRQYTPNNMSVKSFTVHENNRLSISLTNSSTSGTAPPPSNPVTPPAAAVTVTPLAPAVPQLPRRRRLRTSSGHRRKPTSPVLHPYGFRPHGTTSSTKLQITLPVDTTLKLLERMCSKLLLELTRLQPLRGDLNRLARRFDRLASTHDVSRRGVNRADRTISAPRNMALKQCSL